MQIAKMIFTAYYKLTLLRACNIELLNNLFTIKLTLSAYIDKFSRFENMSIFWCPLEVVTASPLQYFFFSVDQRKTLQ